MVKHSHFYTATVSYIFMNDDPQILILLENKLEKILLRMLNHLKAIRYDVPTLPLTRFEFTATHGSSGRTKHKFGLRFHRLIINKSHKMLESKV